MWWLIALAAAMAIYLYLKFVTYNYWAKRGVPCPNNVSLFFGHIGDALFMRRNLGQIYNDIYWKFNHLPYVGTYKMRTPALLICDPVIVKDILIKDYDHFEANDIDANPNDTLMTKNPFLQHGEQWKRTRSMLNPCYTSGKTKSMFPIIAQINKDLVKFVKDEMKTNRKDGLEVKDICSKYTINVVSECAFGLKGQSFTNPNFEFYRMGRAIFAPAFFRVLAILTIFVAPELVKILNVSFVPRKIGNYFRNVITSTLNYRKINKIVRNDFLDMMLDLKEKHKGSFDDEDVTAHALGFFLDGFETTSTSMQFMLYLLAKHQDEQDKLREEINDVLQKHNSDLTYEALQDMPFLDCVFNESTRIYPVVYFLTRRCTKSYQMPAVNEGKKPLTVEPGTPINICFYGFHMNEKYFPEPEKFDPSRFIVENRKNIQKCTHITFGEGPKSCLGQRFGLTQLKAGVASIIKNFKVTVNPKTVEPVQICPKSFMTSAVGGIWLDFEKIE